jgi:glycosyltransferase involved in cell wall biosynthesis
MSIEVFGSTPRAAFSFDGRRGAGPQVQSPEDLLVRGAPAGPLRVLLVHNAYQHRGGEDMVADAELELLTSRGHEVREYRQNNEAIQGLDRFSVLRHTLWSPQTVGEITRLIRTFAPDVIHAHNTFALISPSLYWAAADAGVPVVQTLHNFRLLCAQAMFLRNETVCEDCLGTLPWRGVIRKCYRGSTVQSAGLVSMLALHRAIGTYTKKVTRYIALSEFSREKFISGGLPAEKVRVKHNFVDITYQTSGSRSGGLFVGRLSQEKGAAVFMKALESLPNSGAVVIGTGPQESLIKDRSGVRYLGWQDQAAVQAAMRTASYLVLPSICYEQFPRTLVEAYACELPVIASRLGPLTEFVEEGKTGLLFTPNSPADLAEKIRWAEAHPSEMAEIGRRARTEYEAKYTARRNYLELMEIYAEAIAAAKCASPQSAR